ncbi:F0F1 ATP synthase subunit B [Orrella sp. 11846]|uniref:F0F1 ATP synthase subunit B n=1 Tax=Orrella sp. 11846 TaxID=3409913 RepID=UPI003B5CD06E
MNLNATLFFQMIVFFVLAWVTMKFIWPPLIKAIDERRQKIADGLAAAEKGQSDLAQSQARIVAMEEAAKSDLHARTVDAEKHGQQIIEQARAEAEVERARIVEQARQEAELEMQRARDALRDQVASLAVQGASKILRREVDANAHAELLTQLKAQL